MIDESQLDSGVESKQLPAGVSPMLIRHIGRVSAIFDGAPIGVALWSCEGKLLHANPVMCGLVQRSLDDLAGESISTFIDSAHSDAVMAMLAEVGSGARSAFEWSMRCRQSNGTDQWLNAHVTGIYGGGSSPEYVISQVFSFVDVRSSSARTDPGPDDAPVARAVTRWDKSRQPARPTLPHKRWSEDELSNRYDIIESIAVAVAVCDGRGDIVRANRRWREIISGQSPDQFGDGSQPDTERSRTWFEGISDEQLEELRNRIRRGAVIPQPFTMRVFISPSLDTDVSAPLAPDEIGATFSPVGRHRDGSLRGFWGDLTVMPQRSGNADSKWTMTFVEGSADSVGGSRVTQLAQAIDASTDYLLFIEADMSISYANDAAIDVLGIPSDEIRGNDPVYLMDVLGGEAPELFHDVVQPALVFDSTWRGELDMKSADDETISVSVVFQAHTGNDGRIESITVVARDIGDLKAAQLKLQALATHDYLTGLANRVLLYTRLEQALARFSRYGHPVALMFIDLDQFKPVNDRLGHHVGDEVLMAVADRIHSVIRTSDSAARLGGDEFAILIEGVADVARHKRMAERLIAVISEPVRTAGVEASVGASVGIVQADGTCTTPDSLMVLADRAMYMAKSAGRGRSVVVNCDGHVIG